MTATNPESGSITYTYDERGNLKTRSDARGTVSYCYDNLNRLTKKQYSNDLSCSSPDVKYLYDTSQGGLTDSFPVGRRTGAETWAGGTLKSAHYYAHNAAGRVSTQRTTVLGISKESQYTYNPNGSAATVTYPHAIGSNGRTITYSYDGAARPASVAEGTTVYATATAYSPHGAITIGTLGSSISLSNSYNNRLQPETLSAIAGSNSLMSRTYNFNPGHNNGNVLGITDNLDVLNIAGRPTGSMSFTYDGENRILTAQSVGADCSTTGGVSKNWGNSYTIDPWGNLTNVAVTKCTAPWLNESVDKTNRFSPSDPALGRYDAAGNLVQYGAYVYDAENRLIKLGGDSAPRYLYDADGNRITKATAIYWLGADGNILSESTTDGRAVSEYVFFGGKRVARIDIP